MHDENQNGVSRECKQNHLLAAKRARLLLSKQGTAVIRTLLFESRAIGISTRPLLGTGTPAVRLIYTLWIVCALNCPAKSA